VNDGTGQNTTANVAVAGDATDLASSDLAVRRQERTQGVPSISPIPTTFRSSIKGTASQVADVKSTIAMIEGTARGRAARNGAPGLRSNERTRVIYLDRAAPPRSLRNRKRT